MKLFGLLLAASLVLSLSACQQDSQEPETTSPAVSQAAMQKVSALGFSTAGMQATDGGYIVEGDIFLSEEDLNRTDLHENFLRVGDEEQYRTTYTVTRLPRTITVATTGLPTVYTTALDEAIRRYNALNLYIPFRRVSSGATITLVGFNQGPDAQGFITLGSAGFPTSSGNPFNQIRMNTNAAAYGTNPNVNYLASVIQHEIGHCIGFRHTDYANRAYSCGGAFSNEGASNVGAIRIPGTPSGADPNSWMLACSNGSNRTFNSNDVTALYYLY